ncbi:16S rRNA (uracil(1498)-N(3))-methyltransferase [Alkalicoccobacillus murimartini]|uniref:Ribosomal RNA small subunit methyltransferase E n=1 Tax=Alkalicoccobacillus murimartini TaxID=171685 RepID=A0ABT9YEP4_9BACI|nr:16S rRNA (uracil(1498)-N(3))-methyltransferase [Alkalicoccobacillus murimartini]MDQ0205529.1 16S rRNA (uracil1498-N3)-methyltransferase [Alkalicoccobacillus murimartini]
MQRYFVPNDQMSDKQVTIKGDDASHITRVMRMQPGQSIVCINQKQRVVLCMLESVDSTEVSASIKEEQSVQTELPIEVTIAQALPKGDKFDLIVQKGTELGASGFLPFSAARSIVKWDAKKSAKKIERLEKIAKEAAEQSYRMKLPVIYPNASTKQVIETFHEYTACLILAEEQAKAGETSILAHQLTNMKPGDKLLVLIGPEGGFSEDEIVLFEQAGAKACGLGPRILRTETASLAVLAAISYHFELMR